MHTPIYQNARLSLLFQYLLDHEGAAQSPKREHAALGHGTWVQCVEGVLNVPKGVRGMEMAAEEV
jgi:hypothetical protein